MTRKKITKWSLIILATVVVIAGCAQPFAMTLHPARELTLKETDRDKYEVVKEMSLYFAYLDIVGFNILNPGVLDQINQEIDNNGGDRISNVDFDIYNFNIAGGLVNYSTIYVSGDILKFKE